MEDQSINSFLGAQGFYQRSEKLELWLVDKASKDLATLRLSEMQFSYNDDNGNRIIERKPKCTIQVVLYPDNAMEKEEAEARYWYGNGVELEDVKYKGLAVRCVKV